MIDGQLDKLEEALGAFKTLVTETSDGYGLFALESNKALLLAQLQRRCIAIQQLVNEVQV